MSVIVVLAVFWAVLGLQQWMIRRLRKDVVCLADCIDLLNTSVKLMKRSTSIEPTPEQLDRINVIVMQEIARQLDDDDDESDDAVVH